MRILFLTLSNKMAASSRTRVFQYVPHLLKKGIIVKIIQYESGLNSWLMIHCRRQAFFQKIIFLVLLTGTKIFHIIYAFFSVAKLILLVKNYDILFIQKALPPIWIQRILFKRNNKIVFDFDDAIYADKNAYHIDRFEYTSSHTKLAIIENDDTENYMKERGIKTLKITGPIDCERYKPRMNAEASQNICVGWIGSSSTTHYIQLIEKPLQYISKKYPNVILTFIGASEFKLAGCRVTNEEWSLATEVKLLEKFDIGIMPLPDNEWTRGKGGYKLLQYAAMGIPNIASPVGVNKEIIIEGETGFLAQSDEEWINAFEKLINDKNLRIEMAHKDRKRAEAAYSFEVNTEILVNEFENLLRV